MLCWRQMLALLAILLAPPATADDVVRLTLHGHPELAAIEARIDGLRAAVPRARVQADPVLGLTWSNMPLTRPWPGQHPMSGVQIALSQRWTGGAKIEARVQHAQARVQADAAALDHARNRLGALAASLWYRLALQRELAGLTRAHRATVEQMRAVLQVRYATNVAAQHDLIQLDLLDAELAEAAADHDAQAQALVARLNAAMGRDPAAAIVTPALPPPTAPTARDVDAHPALTRLTAHAAAEAAGVARAEAERRPDVTVSAQYRVRTAVDGGDPGDDFIGVGVAMPLPWLWNDARWGAQAAQHQAQQRALTAQARILHRSLTADLAAARSAARRAQDRAAQIEAVLLPKARAVLDSTLAGYRVGRAPFEALYRAQRQRLRLQQTLREARAASALANVQIRAASGGYATPVTP